MAANDSGTKYQSLTRSRRVVYAGIDTFPSNPRNGDQYYDNLNNRLAVYIDGQWYFGNYTTTTSTSTSTSSTSTSTSTTTTSTSTTSTSTTTSTTTTL